MVQHITECLYGAKNDLLEGRILMMQERDRYLKEQNPGVITFSIHVDQGEGKHLLAEEAEHIGSKQKDW